MTTLTATLIYLAWLAIGLLVARCMSPTKDIPMIDLLERKLDDLDDAVRAGRITDAVRKDLVAALIDNARLVCDMQELVTTTAADVVHAELIATTSAPELHLYTTASKLHHWLSLLRRLNFRDVGITDIGYEMRGSFVVRIINRHPDTVAVEVAA